jgi:hypothetical protein
MSAPAFGTDDLQEGQRVLVKWNRLGWLPGTFEGYSSPDVDEEFRRCKVKMDNGFACNGFGYHPDCVRAEAETATVPVMQGDSLTEIEVEVER